MKNFSPALAALAAIAAIPLAEVAARADDRLPSVGATLAAAEVGAIAQNLPVEPEIDSSVDEEATPTVPTEPVVPEVVPGNVPGDVPINSIPDVPTSAPEGVVPSVPDPNIPTVPTVPSVPGDITPDAPSVPNPNVPTPGVPGVPTVPGSVPEVDPEDVGVPNAPAPDGTDLPDEPTPVVPAPGVIPEAETPEEAPAIPEGTTIPGEPDDDAPQVPTGPTPPRTPAPGTPTIPNPTFPIPDEGNATPPEPQVLIAEIAVTAESGEPLSEELRDIVFEAVTSEPGFTTTRSQLQADVNAIFATGFFGNVRVVPTDTPLGVRVAFLVTPNPELRAVEITTLPSDSSRILPEAELERIFGDDYNQILNLNELRQDIGALNQWYRDNGYTLAQVIGSPEVDADGTVRIQIAEGRIESIRVAFFDLEEGDSVEGKTRPFIVTREMQLKPGDVFNQETARNDLRRIFGLGLFEDARFSFEPGSDPSQAVVVVELAESNFGSFGAGGGVSSASGLFGSVSFQQQNLGGNDQNLGVEVQLGTRDFLFNLSFTDPWIATEDRRTSYTVNFFRSQAISTVFDNGEIDVDLPNGDRPRVVRLGGGIRFTQPQSEPFEVPKWVLSTGARIQNVSIRDADNDITPFDEEGNLLSFNEDGTDNLLFLDFSASQDRRNNRLTPTKGSFLSLSTNQSVPINGIFFNRLRANYSRYFPVKIFNFTEGPEALAFNVQGGTVIGDLPPYEAFAIGGSNSVRGYESGAVASSRSFVQATAEYRFPVLRLGQLGTVGGVFFFDAASDLGTQDNVPGEPGNVRDKPGSGFGYGVGLRVQSPIGPLRVDFGINDQGDNRVSFGIGERF